MCTWLMVSLDRSDLKDCEFPIIVEFALKTQRSKQKAKGGREGGENSAGSSFENTFRISQNTHVYISSVTTNLDPNPYKIPTPAALK